MPSNEAGKLKVAVEIKDSKEIVAILEDATRAAGYLTRLLVSLDVEPLDTLAGMATQVDNALSVCRLYERAVRGLLRSKNPHGTYCVLLKDNVGYFSATVYQDDSIEIDVQDVMTHWDWAAGCGPEACNGGTGLRTDTLSEITCPACKSAIVDIAGKWSRPSRA